MAQLDTRFSGGIELLEPTDLGGGGGPGGRGGQGGGGGPGGGGGGGPDPPLDCLQGTVGAGQGTSALELFINFPRLRELLPPKAHTDSLNW